MITVVGGLPEPVGGVTNYLYRFTLQFKGQVNRVIDLYPARKKWGMSGVKVFVRPESKFFSVFWLLFQIQQCKEGVIYFNFSTPKSLLLLLFIPKFQNVSWALTLHHGALSESMYSSSVWIKKLVKIAINRVDRVGFISENQHEFYKSIDVDSIRLFSISTYLPYVDYDSTSDASDGALILSALERFKENFPKLVVASGYPTSLYRHDWVLSYFDTERPPEVGLVICLYGADSEGLLKYYKEWALRLPNVIVFEGLSPSLFRKVLRFSDVYVRPTIVDSYGVAVAEAIECGLVVVASDACERAQGAYIFPRSSQDQFIKMLESAIKGELSVASKGVESGVKSLELFLGV